MEIKVSRKLAKEIRERHVEAQKRISEFGNEREEQGQTFSMCTALDVAATGFLLYNVHAYDMTIKESVDDFLGFIIEHCLKEFVQMPDMRDKVMKEMAAESGDVDGILHAFAELLEKSGRGFLAEGDTLQEVADQVQGMADAEKATKQ